MAESLEPKPRPKRPNFYFCDKCTYFNERRNHVTRHIDKKHQGKDAKVTKQPKNKHPNLLDPTENAYPDVNAQPPQGGASNVQI